MGYVSKVVEQCTSKLFFLLFVGLYCTSLLNSQELNLTSGASVKVSAGDVLYVNNNLSVNDAASLTISSNSSSSGSLLVTGTSTGNIIYDRYIADTDWYLVASPVASQSINAFTLDANNAINTSGSNYAVATYNNANATGSRWEYYTTSTLGGAGNFTSAKGYCTNRTSAGYFTFEGTLVTDDKAISITTASGSHTWACVGNPYPFFLKGADGAEINSILKENFNKLNDSYKALYVWNGTAYQALNYASGTIYIAPGQAFMVKANSANESFNFSESLQSHQSGATTFYKTVSTPTIELFANNGSSEKMTTLKYYENTTLGLDPGYDAAAFENGIPSFSLNTHLVEDSQGLNFTIQCLPNSNYDQAIVPVSVNADAGSTLSFSSVYSGDLPEDLHIYLEDIHENQITDLKVETYEVYIQDTIQGVGRFYLRTTSEDLNTIKKEPNHTTIRIYYSDREIIINGMRGNQKVTLNLYNPLGQLIFTNEISNTTSRVSIALPTISTGVYIAELQTAIHVYSQRLFINQ